MDIAPNMKNNMQPMTIEEMKEKIENLGQSIAERDANIKEMRRKTAELNAQLRAKRIEINKIQKAQRHKQRVQEREEKIEDFKAEILNIAKNYGSKAQKLAEKIIYEAAQEDNIIFDYKRALEEINAVYDVTIDLSYEKIEELQREQENSYMAQRVIRNRREEYRQESTEILKRLAKATESHDDEARIEAEKELKILRDESCIFFSKKLNGGIINFDNLDKVARNVLSKQTGVKTDEQVINEENKAKTYLSKVVKKVLRRQTGVKTAEQVINKQRASEIGQPKTKTYTSGKEKVKELNEKIQEKQELRARVDEKIARLERQAEREKGEEQKNAFFARLNEVASEAIKRSQIRAKEQITEEGKEEKQEIVKKEETKEIKNNIQKKLEIAKRLRDSIDNKIKKLENEVDRRKIDVHNLIAKMDEAARQKGITPTKQAIEGQEQVKANKKSNTNKKGEIPTNNLSEEEIIGEYDNRIQAEISYRGDIKRQIQEIKKQISSINNDRKQKIEELTEEKNLTLAVTVKDTKIWNRIGVFLFNRVNGVKKFKAEIDKKADNINQQIEKFSEVKGQLQERVKSEIKRMHVKKTLDRINIEQEKERKEREAETNKSKENYFGDGGFSVLE